VIPSSKPGDPPDDAVHPVFVGQQSDYSFCLDQTDILLQTPQQSPSVVAGIDLLFWPGGYPNIITFDPHVKSGNVVSKEIKSTPALEIELRVVPMAGQDSTLNAALAQRKAHMRATIV
jgi:hypothetical protein